MKKPRPRAENIITIFKNRRTTFGPSTLLSPSCTDARNVRRALGNGGHCESRFIFDRERRTTAASEKISEFFFVASIASARRNFETCDGQITSGNNSRFVRIWYFIDSNKELSVQTERAHSLQYFRCCFPLFLIGDFFFPNPRSLSFPNPF